MIDVYDELDRVRDLYESDGLESLSKAEKVLLAVLELEQEVNNGGFHQYYYNSTGDFALSTPAAFDSIGAHNVAQIVLEANAFFGKSGPPTKTEDRRTRLEELGDELFFEKKDEVFLSYPDDIAALLSDFLAKKAE